MIENPFGAFLLEEACIEVDDVEQWDQILSILENEEGLIVGFNRDRFRDMDFFFVYYDVDSERVHCCKHPYPEGYDVIPFRDLYDALWSHLEPLDIDVGELF